MRHLSGADSSSTRVRKGPKVALLRCILRCSVARVEVLSLTFGFPSDGGVETVEGVGWDSGFRGYGLVGRV